MNPFFGNPDPQPRQENDTNVAMGGAPDHERQRAEEDPGAVKYTPPPEVEAVAAGQIPGPAPESFMVVPTSDAGEDAKPELPEVPGAPTWESSSQEAQTGSSMVTVTDVVSDGDVLVGGGDVTKVVHAPVRYQQGPALLRSREIGPDEILSDKLFVPTRQYEGAQYGVFALIGPPSSGRGATGRRLLGSLPDGSRLRAFLPADWDEPDLDKIPNDARHGYLLDLTGMGEALPECFSDDLTLYAKKAREHGTLLVVLGDESVGRRLPYSDVGAGIVVLEHRRPDALAVARKRIEASDRRERVTWLDVENGAFHGLVSSDAPPARGAELARAVLKAKHETDTDVLKGFADWQNQIQNWFEADVRGQGAKGAEERALRIAAAFLDGCPAPAVLNAADELLPQVVRDQFEKWGGALAAPDDRVRCRDAEVVFKDGRISVTDSGKGLDLAVIRYLWDRRGSAADRLTDWLSEISAASGPAATCLDRLSKVLTEVAVARGSGTVLTLLEQWLREDARQRMDFVVNVLHRLTEHPVLGARVRVVDLRNWAKGAKYPERQRAVIKVCRGEFAESYPEQALMRLRYVVQNTDDTDLRREAISAIAEHLAPGRQRLTALRTLVDWVEGERTSLVGGRLFLELFGGSDADDYTWNDPAHGLLALSGTDGETAVQLFRKAWKRIWDQPDLRTSASHALVAWRHAADAESLPFDRTRHVLSVTFPAEGINDDFDRIIGPQGRMGRLLFKDLYDRTRSDLNGKTQCVQE